MKHRVYYLVSRGLKEAFKKEAPGLALAVTSHQVTYPRAEFGDYASNVAMVIAQAYPQLAKEGAGALAKHLAATITAFDTEHEFKKIEAVGGFINFTLADSFLVSKLADIMHRGERYGESNIGEGQTAMIEYLAPNTNKPLHLGHIRNGCLGMSLARLLLSQKYAVIKASIINDRGIHICKSMLAWKKWGEGVTPVSSGKKGDHFVGKWYVRFAGEEKNNPELIKEAQDMLRKWEQGDSETVQVWRQMRQWVLEGFAETYRKFDFTFDKEYFESEVYEQGKGIVEQGLASGVFRTNEAGNTVFDLPVEDFGTGEDGKARMLTVLRQDGTSLYITQDLGLAVRRASEFRLDRMIYVVGAEQKFHFQSLFAMLKKLGYSWADRLYHLAYGMVYLPEGKMKSREGTVVDADDLYSDMQAMAKEEIKKRQEGEKITSQELAHRSKITAIAAIKFYFLRNRPGTDIHFDPKESISFEGFTGPYIQYTHARIYGILRKSNLKFKISNPQTNPKFQILNFKPEELAVMRKLHQFPEIVESAAEDYAPNAICKYLFELAQEFNAFYQAVPVLAEPNSRLKSFRIALLNATAQTLKNGLSILGIEAPEEM